jgi:hypothetical protein
LYFVFYTRYSYVTCFVSRYIPFQFKEVIELIDQTSANSVHECLPCAAKAGTNYAERKVHSGDLVDSDRSKFSPDSAVSDEDMGKKWKVAKTESPLRKELGPPLPLIWPVYDGDDVVDVDEEEVSII